MELKASRYKIKNRILLALPEADREAVFPKLEAVDLPFGKVLYEIGAPIDYVYFHNNGMSSLISYTQEGTQIEVSMVGYEGVTGLQAFLGTGIAEHHAVMQIADYGFRMRAAEFKQACNQVPSLQAVILRYTQALMTQLTQSVVCSRFHPIEQRLCRWLLISQDAIRSDEIHLTQEYLAAMLGVNRPGVTIAARLVQNTGLISYSRGRIVILDRGGWRQPPASATPLSGEPLSGCSTPEEPARPSGRYQTDCASRVRYMISLLLIPIKMDNPRSGTRTLCEPMVEKGILFRHHNEDECVMVSLLPWALARDLPSQAGCVWPGWQRRRPAHPGQPASRRATESLLIVPERDPQFVRAQ